MDDKRNSFCIEMTDLVNNHLGRGDNEAQMASVLITFACIMSRACNGEHDWVKKIKNMVDMCIDTTAYLDMDQICKFKEDPTSSSQEP